MEQKLRHSYWIPTNREIENLLNSYLAEIEYVYQKYKMAIPVYILDSGNEYIEKLNREAVAKVSRKYPHLDFYYLDFNSQKYVMRYIIAESKLSHQFERYFIINSVNYGAVMNKIYLLASALNYDVIHRRDSDTYLQANAPFPLEKEIMYIGKPFNNGKEKYDCIYVVGSGYVGEWNIDLKQFLSADPELFRIFLSALDIPDERHDIYINSAKHDIEKYFIADFDTIVYQDQNNKLHPVAGNFALYQLHKKFPNNPANFTLAADYFTFKMAVSLGYPMLVHERRVFHAYHKERREKDAVDRYLKSLFKFCDASPVYYDLNQEIKKACLIRKECQVFETLEWISQILIKSSEGNLIRRKRNLRNFIELFVSVVYPDIALDLKAKQENYMEECMNDYKHHADLMKNWIILVHAAEKCNVFLTEQLKLVKIK